MRPQYHILNFQVQFLTAGQKDFEEDTIWDINLCPHTVPSLPHRGQQHRKPSPAPGGHGQRDTANGIKDLEVAALGYLGGPSVTTRVLTGRREVGVEGRCQKVRVEGRCQDVRGCAPRSAGASRSPKKQETGFPLELPEEISPASAWTLGQ